jgi:hypothetical protein
MFCAAAGSLLNDPARIDQTHKNLPICSVRVKFFPDYRTRADFVHLIKVWRPSAMTLVTVAPATNRTSLSASNVAVQSGPLAGQIESGTCGGFPRSHVVNLQFRVGRNHRSYENGLSWMLPADAPTQAIAAVADAVRPDRRFGIVRIKKANQP